MPDPALPRLDEPYSMLIAGVGGTGVVTLGALIGMAAHLEGKGVTVLDQTGLSQKGGAVLTHVRIAAAPGALHAPRIVRADLLLGCDLLVAAGPDALQRLRPGHTRAVVNTAEAITGDFVRHPEQGCSRARPRSRCCARCSAAPTNSTPRGSRRCWSVTRSRPTCSCSATRGSAAWCRSGARR